MPVKIELPIYGITITLDGKGGNITSSGLKSDDDPLE